MHHATVKRIAVRNFQRVTDHDCALDIHQRFGGGHVLGGERHDCEGPGRKDSQAVDAALWILAAHGIEEALAAPIAS